MALVKGKEQIQDGRKNGKWVSHYSNMQRILLVGEGDFSFSSCLATGFGVANRMIATSLDSKNDLKEKYGKDAEIHISNLIDHGALVFHEFDACNMAIQHSTPLCGVEHASFDRIIFNFPHAGFPKNKREEAIVMQKHKELLQRFFANAKRLLLPRGQVHVSHKLGDAYDKWKLEDQAQMAGFELLESVPFVFEAFPGYKTRRGVDKDAGRRFPLGKASTYIFVAKQMEQPAQALNAKTEHEMLDFLATWKSILPEIIDLKAKMVQQGQASKETSLLQILVDEVERLKQILEKLTKKKATRFQLLDSILKEMKICLIQGDLALSSSVCLVETTYKLPKCLKQCEFCGASLKIKKN